MILFSEVPELDPRGSWSLNVLECVAGNCDGDMTLGPPSYGDFEGLMSLWTADISLEHPVLLTQNAELDRSGSVPPSDSLQG